MVIGVGSDLKQSKQHMPSLLIILKYENNQGVTKPKKVWYVLVNGYEKNWSGVDIHVTNSCAFRNN